MLNSYFKFKENGTDLKTEIIVILNLKKMEQI